MVSKVTVNEDITFTYADGKINISGKTFKATLFVSQDSLMSVYMGGQGNGTARLTLDNVIPYKANT
jgi:hypothetical protein